MLTKVPENEIFRYRFGASVYAEICVAVVHLCLNDRLTHKQGFSFMRKQLNKGTKELLSLWLHLSFHMLENCNETHPQGHLDISTPAKTRWRMLG